MNKNIKNIVLVNNFKIIIDMVDGLAPPKNRTLLE